MQKDKPQKLFPFALVAGNVEGLQSRHRRGGYTIYLTVVIGLLLAAASLPLIQIDVNSQSRGILRPALKMSPVSSPVSGLITFSELRENGQVNLGDTLLIVSTESLEKESQHLDKQAEERRLLLTDLQRLTEVTATAYPTLTTAVYQRDYGDYRQQRDGLELQLTHANRQLARQQELIESGSIARMELEQAAYEVENLEGQLAQLAERQRHLWTQELQRNRRELAELNQQRSQLRRRAREYVITAPVAGNLTQTGGLQNGSYVTAGQPFAQISPDGQLHVETYVKPGDIGLLRTGLPVQLQLDAFNYNQWGLASATLVEIGTDVTEIDGTAAFLVTCELHDCELSLKNGYVGTLKKGMTLTAHFNLTRRSLFQLLHDKLDDWFNPVYN